MNLYSATISVERSPGLRRLWDSIAMSTMTYETRPLPARNESLCAADTPLLRPGPQDLSETIPVFFIGRNTHGHLVARGADGKSGGLFWRKQAAIRFARRSVWPARCATIFPADNIELDLENQGNPLLAQIDVRRVLRIAGGAIDAVLLMAILAGTIALKTGIFLSRLNY
jgi:hypothetical protein